MLRRLAAIAFGAALLALVACGEGANAPPPGTGSPTPGPTPTRSPLPAPIVAKGLFPAPGSIYFGAYVNSSGLVGGNTEAATESLEAVLGRRLALHMQYEDFSAEFARSGMVSDFDEYRIPIVSWNCAASDYAIASGDYDSTIRLKAIAAREYGWPVFVRYMWDPNLPASMLLRSICYSSKTDTGGQFSPSEYIAAWDRIHSIFQQEGATNVVWLWTVSTNPSASSPLAYYPGNAEVDWVGMDSYDLNDGSFAATYASTYAQLATLGKPVMISETGASSQVQPSFFTGAAATLQAQFPLVHAFLYYDGIDYVTGQNEDWRIVQSAFPSFITFANDPYMAAQYAP